jgi:hypothetical protein
MCCSLPVEAHRQIRRLAATERERDDNYPTQPWVTHALLKREKPPGPVWEPAAGAGAMSRVLQSHGHQVVSTDLVDRGFCPGGTDFLMVRHLPKAPDGTPVRSVFTNPPFKLAEAFVEHALDMPGIEYAAFLLRLPFLEGLGRAERIYTVRPPARVRVLARRPAFAQGTTETKVAGIFAYAWFVWQRPAGEPWPVEDARLHWILDRPGDLF